MSHLPRDFAAAPTGPACDLHAGVIRWEAPISISLTQFVERKSTNRQFGTAHAVGLLWGRAGGTLEWGLWFGPSLVRNGPHTYP